MLLIVRCIDGIFLYHIDLLLRRHSGQVDDIIVHMAGHVVRKICLLNNLRLIQISMVQVHMYRVETIRRRWILTLNGRVRITTTLR